MFLLAFPLILLAMLGTGAWALARLRVVSGDVLEETWYAGVIGLLLVGSLTTALGLGGLYATIPLGVMVVALVVVTFRWWRQLFAPSRWSEQWRELGATGPLYLGLTLLLIALLAIYAFLALAPNVQWDTMAHHFLVPWMYLREGSIYDLQQVEMSYFPSLLQVMYGLGMGIGGEQTASLLGWWWSTWVIVGVLVIGRNLWGWEAGVASAIVMATMELYGKQLLGGWADAGVALFVLLGSYAPLRWHRTSDRAWMYLGGLAMGGALAASKHNALLPFGLVVMGMAWWWVRDLRSPQSSRALEDSPQISPAPQPPPLSSQTRPGEGGPNNAQMRVGPRSNGPKSGQEFSALTPPPQAESARSGEGAGGLGPLLAYLGLALLPPLVWYFRAYLLTGSPVYPLTFWGLFPGPELPVYAESSWVDQSYARSPFNALTYPLLLTLGTALPEGFQGRFPIQWLIGIPIVWLFRGRSPIVRWWSWLLLATLLAMYQIAPKETRYMLFAVPWLALLTGLGMTVILKAIPQAMVALLAGVLLLGGPLIWRNFGEPWRLIPETWSQSWQVVVKKESRAKYIARATPVTAAISRMNSELPDDAFVFCLEDRTYRLTCDWTNYYAATEPFPQTAEESYTFCYRQGVTHLFLGDGTITQPTIFRNIVDLTPDADGITRFTQGQVMFNILGEPINPSRHWVAWSTIRRALQRAGFEITVDPEGIETYSIPHERLLSTPIQQAHYNVINSIEEMVRRGWLTPHYSDGLGMVLAYDYAPIAAYEDPSKFGVGRPAWTR